MERMGQMGNVGMVADWTEEVKVINDILLFLLIQTSY